MAEGVLVAALQAGGFDVVPGDGVQLRAGDADGNAWTIGHAGGRGCYLGQRRKYKEQPRKIPELLSAYQRIGR